MPQVQAAAAKLRREHLKALKSPTKKKAVEFQQAVIGFKALYPDWREKLVVRI